MTVAKIASLLKINQQTLRNWIDDGRVLAVRVGRRVRVRRSDFDRLVQEGYSGPSLALRPAGPTAEEFWRGEAVFTAQSPGARDDEPVSGV